jgi:hypothetical protein
MDKLTDVIYLFNNPIVFHTCYIGVKQLHEDDQDMSKHVIVTTNVVYKYSFYISAFVVYVKVKVPVTDPKTQRGYNYCCILS